MFRIQRGKGIFAKCLSWIVIAALCIYGSQDVQGDEPILCGIRSSDQQIIQFIAADVLKHADFEVTDAAEDELVIRLQTNSGGEWPMDREVFDQWSETNSISYDLLVDHYIRNGRSIIINNLVTVDPKLKQDDLREIIRQGAFYPEYAFPKKYPKAKGWLDIYLPGYSKDGNYAMIRCSWEPSMHGNMGYYLFKRTEDGTWQLLTKRFEYYL